VVDTTPPSLTVSGDLTVEQTSPAGAVAYYADPVATDAAGPVTVTSTPASGSVFAPGTTVVTVTAVDVHGNQTVKTFKVTVRDTLPPLITIFGVTDGATYRVAGVPAPSYAVSDSGSGVKTSAATLTAPGTATGAGKYVYAITAADVAGNTAAVTVAYAVEYRFGGFRQVLSRLQFALHDAFWRPVSNAVVTGVTIDGIAAATTFTWDPVLGAYRFDLPATLATGDHVVQANLDDGTVREALVYVAGTGTAAVSHGSLSLSSTALWSGQSVGFGGAGYLPGSAVTLNFGNGVLMTVTASPVGFISGTFMVPAGLAPGTYVVTAVGTAPGGLQRVDSRVVTVGAA
jgi:hypothetical protein